MSQAPRIPSYCHHKAKDLAYVTLGPKQVKYLGKYGTPESKAEYERVTALWLLNGRQFPTNAVTASQQATSIVLQPTPGDPGAAPVVVSIPPTVHPLTHGITVAELLEAFLKMCDKEYPSRNGYRNSELSSIESALFSLNKLYGPTAAIAFGPRALKLVQADFIARGFCRKMVNRNSSYVKRVFKWGVQEEMIAGEVFYKLLAVPGLRKGRGEAHDNPPVKPVDEALVAATLPFLNDEQSAMVQLQTLTGMRSGEAVLMRGCDIDRTGKVWKYKPRRHKTENHGVLRQIPLGPKAQAIIKPFFTDNPTDHLFSPRRAEEKRRAKQHAERKTPLSCGNRPGTNRKTRPERIPGERYGSDTYGRAIARACLKAFPLPDELRPDTRSSKTKDRYIAEHGKEAFEAHHAKVMAWHADHHWHPHQLRHTASTRVARKFGEIASQNLLGHTTLKTTAIYTERDWSKAEEAMAVIG